VSRPLSQIFSEVLAHYLKFLAASHLSQLTDFFSSGGSFRKKLAVMAASWKSDWD